MIDDPATAAELFRRIEPHVPATMRGRRAVGANERLRCYRYQPGQRFAPHFDGCFRRDESEESFLTYIIYLNEGFEGGETEFPELGRTIIVVLHDINFAGHYADRICAVKDGRVVEFGPPEQIMTDEVLTRVFDTAVQVVDGPRGPLAVYY